MPFERDIPFIFFLVDTPTGLCYYRDIAGNVQTMSIGAAMALNMKSAPDGWMSQQLGWARNTHYYGLNRSYSIPQKLVNDAAFIVRTLTNQGRGIEVPLTMMIYKYDTNPAPGDPAYAFYYKGQIDLPKAADIVGEGIQANLMEGGFMQLLKAYENTFFQIPCDGSIPENIKINMDGMLFEDTFNYQIIGIDGPSAGAAGVPATFISNEGDNAGIVHADPTYDVVASSPFISNYYQQSQNYFYVSARPVTVRIKGSITFSSSVPGKTMNFALALQTSKSVGATPPATGLTHTTVLVAPTPVNGQQIFTFDQVVSLDANERLFMMMSTLNGTDTNWSLKGGNFAVSFASQFPATYPWGITLYDLGRLLIKQICQAASINGQIYNYDFVSQLLLDNLNLVATAGDALRASGDPNYQRFFNAVVNNPNFPNGGVTYYYGPVIKTCLADYFDSVNAILNASMSTQVLPGQNETIFIEKKGYVFNAGVKNLDNGEVSDVRIDSAMDLYFTLVKIGCTPGQYDQKAGKYAWNTTLEMVSPLKSIPAKILEIISKYQMDPYLLERLRSNVGNTSTTRNGSDNTVFVLNTDPSNFVYESYTARFDAQVPSVGGDPGASGTDNILLLIRQYLQGIGCPDINGAYLSYSNTPAIFLFNQPALSGTTFNLNLVIAGTLAGNPFNVLTGQPADTITLKLWINGVVLQSWTVTANSPATPISIALATTHVFSFKDSIYISADTSATGSASLSAVTLAITSTPSSANYVTAVGSAITIDQGASLQLLSLPTVTAALDGNGRPVVSSGFQYLQFNSILLNQNFNIIPSLSAVMNGGTTGQKAVFDLYLNGVPVFTQTFTRNAAIPNQGFGFLPGIGSPTINHDFQQGDIVFMIGSAEEINFYISDAILQLTSTQIKACNLKRVQYDAISGIPTLLGNLPGTTVPITTGPGAPYNIEQLSPKRMLMTWGNYLRSILWDQIPGELTFSQLSKNEYLSTTKDGVIITENANVSISDLAAILFKAKYITYKTRVQETFATIMTGAANAFVGASLNGVPADGFPVDIKQKPALNESQEWKMLAGPDLDLDKLSKVDFQINLSDMKKNSLAVSVLSPVQIVPAGRVLPAQYHTKSRLYYWFVEQVVNWINQNNYWNPWQNDDPCNLQFVTRDLSQVVVNLYACTGGIIASFPATQKSSPAVSNPYFLWEVSVDLTSLPAGGYYLTVVAGAGANTVTFISEGLHVKPDWPGTLLFEPKHSSNRADMIFDTGYSPCMRVRGFFDNTFKQKYKGAFYVNQPQDIQILNAFQYEVASLFAGLDEGIPDYVHKKVAGYMLFDSTKIEGECFSMDEGAEWQETFIEGNPKKFQKLDIRPSRALGMITQDIDGFTDDATMMSSLDAQYFGPNAGNAGSGDPVVTDVTINT